MADSSLANFAVTVQSFSIFRDALALVDIYVLSAATYQPRNLYPLSGVATT